MKVYLQGTEREVYVKKPRIVDHAMRYMKPNRRVVIQAGAHVGIWPERLQRFFEQVVAFEPSWSSYLACMEMGRLDKTMLIPSALGDKNTVSRMHQQILNGSNKLSAGGFETVMVTMIDSLPRWITSRVDAIFLDIEGAEPEALVGAEQTIEHTRPLVVVEGNHDVGVYLDILPDSYEFVQEFHRDFIFRSTK